MKEDIKRAIVLDMDGTLENGENEYKSTMMTLRPKLDTLIKKLQEAKQNGIDIILCTTATEEWVNRFLALKPEFEEIIDKKYTRDNASEWKNYRGNQKHIETFGYDSILFIDDNQTEGSRLVDMYRPNQENNEITSLKDITYCSAFKLRTLHALNPVFGYIESVIKKPEFRENLQEILNGERKEDNLLKELYDFFDLDREDPGCELMSEVVDSFIKKEFKPGLTLADEQFEERYKEYRNKQGKLGFEFWNKYYMEPDENDDVIEDIVEDIRKFMSTDKEYPYANIESIMLERFKQISNESQLETTSTKENSTDKVEGSKVDELEEWER